jgi:hypothetical protein
MARRISENERRGAVEIVTVDVPPGEEVDDAFDKWREATAEAEVPGKVTAWQIPMDEHGVPQPSAKNQIRLGAWPVDAYAFDDLCALLIREYMTPEKVLCVRLLGTKAGSTGLQFNRVVTLRAPNTKAEPTNGAAGVPDSAAGLMKVIQENNERMLAQFRSMLPQAQAPDAMGEIRRIMELSRMMSEPTNKLLELLVPALVGRPATAVAAQEPFTQLSSLMDVMDKFQELRGGGGEDGGGRSGSDLVESIRAIGQIVKPALEAVPAIMADRARTGAGLTPQRALAGPPRVAPQPGARPTAPPAPGSVPTQPHVAAASQPTAASMGDIPSGDREMFAFVKPQIDALVKMAEEGSDATGAADLLFDQVILTLPDDFYDKLSAMIGGPNFITQTAVFNPKVNSHAEWFKVLQARVMQRYDAEDAAAANAPTVLPGGEPANE